MYALRDHHVHFCKAQMVTAQGRGLSFQEGMGRHRKLHAKCKAVDDPRNLQMYGISKVFREEKLRSDIDKLE